MFATRAHFDYRDHAAVARAGRVAVGHSASTLHSMHAPIVEAIRDGKWVGSFSIASGDETRRKAAVAEAHAALKVAATVPFRYLVVHLGMPDGQTAPANDNQPDAARRSVEEIVALAARGERPRGARGDAERAVERRQRSAA